MTSARGRCSPLRSACAPACYDSEIDRRRRPLDRERRPWVSSAVTRASAGGGRRTAPAIRAGSHAHRRARLCASRRTGAPGIGPRHLRRCVALTAVSSRSDRRRALRRRGTGGTLSGVIGRSHDDLLWRRRRRRRCDRFRHRWLRHRGWLGRRGCGRRHGCRRRGGGISRRKQGQRVDVGLAVTDPEVHVRDLVLGRAGGACLGDRLPLGDERATLHEQRADVRERHLVPARSEDRDRQPVRRNLARERHLASRRRPDDLRAAEGDVDAAMLPAGVRVVPEREAAEHLALSGPRPCTGRRRRRQRPAERQRRRLREPGLPDAGTHDDGSAGPQRGATQLSKLLQRGPIEGVPRSAGQPGNDIGRLPARQPGGDELRDGGERFLVRHVPRHAGSPAEHERDLAPRRLAEPSRRAPRASPARSPRALRQLAADRRRALRHLRPTARAARRAASAATRRRRPDAASARAPPPAHAARRPPRQVPDELVALADEAARHERRLDGRRPGSTVTGSPRRPPPRSTARRGR